MDASVTFITCFFDLQKRENSQRRNKDYYFEKAEFLFKQNQNIIFFIDPELQIDVWKRRKAHNLLDKTYIVPIRCEDLDYVKAHLDATQKNFIQHPVHNFQPGKETPLYILLTWSKFKLLNSGIELNPFNSTHFAWIDFGLSHIAKTTDTILHDCIQHFDDKIKILSMKHLARCELVDMNRYYDWIMGKMAAGFITGLKDNMLKLCQAFDVKVSETIKLGRAILEEQILPLIYTQNPQLFKLYYGDYDHILLNYNKIQGNIDLILTNVVWSRERREFEMAFQICEALLDSSFQCPPVKMLTIFHEAFINGWNSDKSKCLMVLSKLSVLCDKDPEFRKVYLLNYPKLKNFNLSFDLVSIKIGIVDTSSAELDLSKLLDVPDLNKLLLECQVIIFTGKTEQWNNFPPCNPCYKRLTEISDFPGLKFISQN